MKNKFLLQLSNDPTEVFPDFKHANDIEEREIKSR